MKNWVRGKLPHWQIIVLLGVGWLPIGAPYAQSQQQTSTPSPQMAKDLAPQFEVAVIKPTDPANQSQGFHVSGHRIFIENESMSNLISVAYAIHRTQIVDGPAWFDHERFDIEGVPDLPGAPDFKQVQGMLQKLLTDRFGLKFRRDRRDLSIYAISVVKGGPRITKSKGDPNGLPDQTGFGRGSQQTMKFTNNSMADLALGMQGYMDKPVVDMTGLPGRFDFVLTWTPDLSATDEANVAPGIFTAFQEQLGLKLQATKGPADVLVIEHAERPSQN